MSAGNAELADIFRKRAEDVRTLNSPVSNDDLLQLYALFKQATCGNNETDCPGMFDFKGRAKWKAWAAVKDTTTDDAQKRYIELVERLQAADVAK